MEGTHIFQLIWPINMTYGKNHPDVLKEFFSVKINEWKRKKKLQ